MEQRREPELEVESARPGVMRVQIGAHLLTVHIHSSLRIGSGDNGKRKQAGSADTNSQLPT